MQCSNNQKQVVLAMHNYHDVQQSFPWGTRSGVFGTWAVQVLPFIEKEQIHAGFGWEASAEFSWDTVISTYTCPSDGNNHKSSYEDRREHNYVVCMGREGVFRPTYYHATPRNCLIDGVVYGRESQYRAMFTASCHPLGAPTLLDPAYPLTTRFEDVVDGTSNTVAISETVQGVSGASSGYSDSRGIIWWGLYCFFNTNQAPNTTVEDIVLNGILTAHVKHPLAQMNTSTSDGNGNYMRLSARS
jgi:hypothetical protein